MVLPKSHGAVGCAHCHQLATAPSSCRVCRRPICKGCAADPRSCPTPHPRELRLGLGGRLKDVDPGLNTGLYSRVGLHLYDLQLHEPRPGMLSLFTSGDSWLPLSADELLWVNVSARAKLILGYEFLRRERGKTKRVASIPGDQQREILPRALRRSEHGGYALVLRTDETVDVLNTRQRSYHGCLKVPGQVLQAVAASEDAGFVVAASFGQLFAFTLDDCQFRGSRPLSQGDVRWLALAQGVVASCDEHGELTVLEVRGKSPRSWTPRGHLESHAGRGLRRLDQGCLSPDGALLARGNKKTVEVYQTATGTLSQILYGHTDTVQFVRFAADGNQLVTADDDNRVIIWPRSAEKILTLEDARAASRDG